MAWIQINTLVKESLAEPLSDALIAQGAVSVTFEDAKDQPIFEPELGTTPIWDLNKVIGLFDAETQGNQVVAQIKQTLPQLAENTFTIEALEDKDWIREWMDQFKPMQFGDNLWIVPSWHTPPQADAVNLMLDPGMAFGTGTHPTTALCLTWLDQHPPTNQTVIDYGCGSGILALAAAKLGATQVKGTDIDPQAIQASEQNAERNQASIEFALVKDFDAPPADLLIANILAGPLKELAPEFTRLLKPQGTLVLSGILTTQAADLITHYQSLGYHFIKQNNLDEWSQLSFQK